MSEVSVESSDTPHIASMSIEAFNALVADPGTFCGGGSVAAVTAAGSAALVDLVLSLSERRKSNAEVRPLLQQSRTEAIALRTRFELAADMDARVLVALMDAQREVRGKDDRTPYLQALENAASAPLEAAEDCMALLNIIDNVMRHSTRFTVSDLGAAATLCLGAVQGAVMMSEVNVSLLADEAGADQEFIDDLHARIERVTTASEELSERIVRYTLSVIRRTGEND